MRRELNPDAARPRATPRIPRPEATPPRSSPDRLGVERRRPTPHTSGDHRWARPHPRHVHTIHHAHPPPVHVYYAPWYTHWWVHPYYRWHHGTSVVVWLGGSVDPWWDLWWAPVRTGWIWVPGYYRTHDWWVPGYYAPADPAPVLRQAEYVYVPGWWIGDAYVEGFWRRAERPGWVWVEGAYRTDGTYAWGHWAPANPGAPGYVWEPGTWDGEAWIEGFWRPVSRDGYRWVTARWDADGVFRAGYWEPLEARRGHVWIPGWFDGTEWIEGYWVSEAEFEAADPDDWTPPEGWDAGRDAPAEPPDAAEPPLALPVTDTSS